MAVVSERFHNLAQSVARARHAPDLPMIVLPPNIEEITNEELHALADRTFPQIIDRLTKPAP